MGIVFKTTKPGYDVLSEDDPNNFIFNSEFNHLKTYSSSNFTSTVASLSEVTVPVAHNLGYRPLVMCYFRNTANNKWFINSAQPDVIEDRYSILANVSVSVDTTNVYFRVSNTSGASMDIQVKYEIFYEGDA